MTGRGEAVALEMLAEARRLLTEVNDLPHLVEVIHVTGYADLGKGRLNDAIAIWEEALAIARSIPDPARESLLQLQIARTHARAGRLPEAIERLEVAERLVEQTGDRRTRIEAARLRAAAIVASTSAEEAAAAFASLIPEVEEMGDQELLEAMFSQMAEQLYRTGDVAGARVSMERALEISEATGHLGRIPEVSADLARLLVEIGEIDAAERHATRAMETAGPWDVTARAAARVAMGVVRGAQGRRNEAEALIREGVAQVAETEYVRDHYWVMTPLACFLLEGGRAEGEAWAERALASARASGDTSPVARIVEGMLAGARARGAERRYISPS